MKLNNRPSFRALLVIALMLVITIASTRLQADSGTCGGATITLPFIDVPASNTFFCSIASAYLTGLTNGTSATTYDPTASVTREQMAAFVTRTLDQSLKRGNRRAALGEWSTSQNVAGHRLTTVGNAPQFMASDGADLWVLCSAFTSIYRVRASDGKVLDMLFPFGVREPKGIVIAAGYVWVTNMFREGTIPSPNIVRINPIDNGSTAFRIGGTNPIGITFDGINIWTADNGTAPGTGSVSRFNISTSVTNTFSVGFNRPYGIVFDGLNLWVTDFEDNSLKRVDLNTGAILQSIIVGANPAVPCFDGTNLWVPNAGSQSVSVVRAVGALRGTVLATLSAEQYPNVAAFDGERICVTNYGANSVSLWKASDLTPIGTFPMPAGGGPVGVCSDGIGFWVCLYNSSKLVHF